MKRAIDTRAARATKPREKPSSFITLTRPLSNLAAPPLICPTLDATYTVPSFLREVLQTAPPTLLGHLNEHVPGVLGPGHHKRGHVLRPVLTFLGGLRRGALRVVGAFVGVENPPGVYRVYVPAPAPAPAVTVAVVVNQYGGGGPRPAAATPSAAAATGRRVEGRVCVTHAVRMQ